MQRIRRSVLLRALLACVTLPLAACDGPNLPPGALRVEAVAGDAQEDTVAAVLVQPLLARVTDDDGRPQGGKTVEFRVLSGGGSVLPAGTASTDAEGRAQVQWKLGTRVGEAQQVEARVLNAPEGSVADTFAATVLPGAAVRIERVSPAQVTGMPNQPIADSLTVRIFDRYDNPAAGRPVQWFGPGTFSPGVSHARADGTARTQHTPTVGYETRNVLAMINATTYATFAITTVRPTVSVVIEAPTAPVAGDTLAVIANTSESANEVVGVTANVEDRAVALVFSNGRWQGKVPLLGLTPGPKVLRVIARDAAGAADTAFVNVEYDPPARLTMEEPAYLSLVVGALRVRAACQDDDPCTLTLTGRGEVLAQGQGSIDQTVPLPAGFAAPVLLRLQTEDAFGRVTRLERVFYAINDPRWTLVARLPPVNLPYASRGSDVLDMDAQRALLTSGQILDLATGQLTEAIPVTAPLRVGYLTPQGVLALTNNSRVVERRGAVVRELGETMFRNWAIRRAGRWAMWSDNRGHTVLDLETGTTRVVDREGLPSVSRSTSGIPGPRRDAGSDLLPEGSVAYSYDIAANGDVLLVEYGHSETRLVRLRNGQRTLLATGGAGNFDAIAYPRTDGTLVVYRRGSEYRLIDAQGNTSILAVNASPNAEFGFALRNGWIAYAKAGPTGVQQVWLRDPDGTQQQLTAENLHSYMERLSPNGKVVFIGHDAPRRVFVPGRGTSVVGGPRLPRFTDDPQMPPVHLFWVGDALYASWAGGLFRIAY